MHVMCACVYVCVSVCVLLNSPNKQPVTFALQCGLESRAQHSMGHRYPNLSVCLQPFVYG